MREETKKSIRNNVGFIVYSVVIIALVFYSGLAGIPLEDVSFVIMLMAILSLWEVFRQALQYNQRRLKRRLG